MVSTGSPVWAEKKYRIMVYVLFLISMSILAFTSYMSYVQDKALDDRLNMAHKISIVSTPTLIGLLGFMMFSAVSKDSIMSSMKPHLNQINKGVSGLRSVT